MKCLICGNELTGCVCACCNFDLSDCGERYPTLTDQAASAPTLSTRRLKLYEHLHNTLNDLEVRAEEDRFKRFCIEKDLAILNHKYYALQEENNILSKQIIALKDKLEEIKSKLVLSERSGPPEGPISSPNIGTALEDCFPTKRYRPMKKDIICSCGCRNSVDNHRYCAFCGKALFPR